jgi:hypothetical protein
MLANAGHQAQGYKFTPALVHILRQPFLQVGFAILKRMPPAPEQHNHPDHVKSHHQQRHERQAAVNLARVYGTGAKAKTKLVENVQAVPASSPP